MTVLGSGKDDKEKLVAKEDVATMMPNRYRLVRLQRRRTVMSLILSIGFILIFLFGIFLTVCFIKKIGPFRRHYSGFCQVGNRYINGHKKIFESFEITDNYALIHVPKFNIKHDTYDSARTIHVYNKKVTVIQHNNMCLVKPMMKFQSLRNDWFDELKKKDHHTFHTPTQFAYFHMIIMRPQLPSNYLRDEVHELAEAMCVGRPVFRLMFKIGMNPPQPRRMCHVKCANCDPSNQVNTMMFIAGKLCRVCKCNRSPVMVQSTNEIDAKCKTIRCENTCVNKKLIGCTRCRCADTPKDVLATTTMQPGRPQPLINDYKLPPMPVEDQFNGKMDDASGHVRQRRSAVRDGCKVVAKIFEGSTPVDSDATHVPLDLIYDC